MYLIDDTKIYLTAKKIQELKKLLKSLKYQLTEVIPEEIEEARSKGDLKENDEYHTAKNKQGEVNSKIIEIEYKLKHAELIDNLPFEDIINIGTVVEIEDQNTNAKMTFIILGPDEADVPNKIISFKTPIARGLLGKKQGDTAKIQIGKNEKEFKILKVDKYAN